MKRHSTDVVSLVFGAIFLAIAAWWLISRYVTVNIPNLGWIAAGALILMGLLGVVASLRGEKAQPPAAAEDEPEPLTGTDEGEPENEEPTLTPTDSDTTR